MKERKKREETEALKTLKKAHRVSACSSWFNLNKEFPHA